MDTIANGLRAMKCPSCALAKSENKRLQINVISTIFTFLLLASVHESSSDTVSKRNSSPSEAEFVTGLANSIRKIHSSKLADISKHSPFQLEFRTECPSANIMYNEKLVIYINHEGHLAYTNKNTNETKIFFNVANGEWHALNFNGSLITFQDSNGHNYPDPASEMSIEYDTKSNEHEHTEEADTDLLYFFDGFVGCVRVNAENSTSANVLYHPNSESDASRDELSADEEFSHTVEDTTNDNEVTAAKIFQLKTFYSGCTDLNHDLKDSHHCHNPETFVYCEKCKGKCVERAIDLDKQNECNCTNSNSGGTYCEFPAVELTEPGRGLPTKFIEIDSEPSPPQGNSRTSPSRGANSSVSRESILYDSPVLTTPPSTTTIPVVIQSTSEGEQIPTPCLCENGGFCSSESQGRCNCPAGFFGDHCEKIECTTKTCVYGVCQNKQCYCTPGYTGSFCEIDIDECNPDPCYKNQTVRCENRVNRFSCICLPGFTSKLCEVNIDDCASNPCENGAECIDGVNSYSCQCLAGFNGTNCEIDINECETEEGEEPKCYNDGKCIDKINGFDCDCNTTGFEGTRCENNINDCLPTSCQHGGTCQDKIKGYICNCHPGYTGYSCEEDIKECVIHDSSGAQNGSLSNGTSPCKEGNCFEFSDESLYDSSAWDHLNIPREFSTEFSYANASGYFCQCPDGFQGKDCEIDLNECELPDGSSPCKEGKCIDGRNNYTCECSAGYESRNCDIEINECASYPCTQGGTCHDKIADFECVCPDGYGSKDCSIKLTGCDAKPCLNVGTCIPTYFNGIQDFTCMCQPGFSGKGCETSTTMSFNGSNYITVSSNDENYRSGKYEMEFRFKTTLSNVLVAVGQGITYFMLTLADGKLNLQSSLLNSLNGISSGTNLSNAEWHKVWILVNETHIALAANSEQTIHPISENDETQGETGFNMTVLGGATPPLNFLNKENAGFFVGCVQDVKINGNGVSVEMAKNSSANITLVNDVKIGCTRKEQCKPNPCLNGGVCTDLWQKYQCRCPRPYLGNKCEFQYNPGTFGNENYTMSIAEVTIAPNVSRKFSNSFDISMFVRTRESRGTIFFLGDESRENGLFIEAQVEDDGKLGVSSKLDEAKKETYTIGGPKINNGIPYLISVQKEKGIVKISINGTEHFRKTLTEKVQFNPTVMLIGGVLPINYDPNESNDFEDSTALPAIEGPTRVVPTISSAIKKKLFKGIIQDVRVNLSSTDVNPSSTSRDHFVVEFYPLNVTMRYSMGESLGNVKLIGGVLEGEISDETCASSPCLNGGSCKVTWNDFECTCIENVYAGKTCDVLLRCAMVSCPIGSQCRNINATGFECVAEAALDGRSAVSPFYRLKSNETDQLSFDRISFRYRSRTGGSVIYLSGASTTLRVALEYEASLRDGTLDRSNFISVYLNSVRYNFNVSGGLDGEWHKVELGFEGNNNLTLKFDDVKQDKEKGKMPIDFHMSSTALRDIVLSRTAQIIVGSYVLEANQYDLVSDTPVPQNSFVYHPESLHDLFKGCLAEVKIGKYELPFVSPELLTKVNENKSLVETTAPTAFYINNSVTLHLGCLLCYEDECRHGGKCGDPSTVYDCACVDGYSGSFCETNIDECLHNICSPRSKCVDQVANYTCECSKGYTGWLCDQDEDECVSSPCRNGGYCINLPADSGFYKCNCTDDYTGEKCERRKLSTCQNGNEPCENGAKCKTIPMRPDGVSFVCECPTGYEGTVCEKLIDHCENVTCANGGTCNNALVGFRCSCMPGWDGPYCSVDRNECALTNNDGMPPCLNNGTCIDGINEFTCNCSGTGFTGENCEVDVDECENHTVQEECFQSFSKTCVNTPGSFECQCQPSLCGTRCDISNPCQRLEQNETCKNGGSCVPMCDEDPNKWMCKCAEGFEGSTCSNTLSSKREQTLNIALIVIPVLTAFLLAAVIAIFILVKMARKKRATRGVYSPSQQEYCNPRVELDNVMKPPPEERLI